MIDDCMLEIPFLKKVALSFEARHAFGGASASRQSRPFESNPVARAPGPASVALLQVAHF
jgi:hypothetical protein